MIIGINGFKNYLCFFSWLYWLRIRWPNSSTHRTLGTFKSITNSLTCLNKKITIDSPVIAEALSIDAGNSISYASYIFNTDILKNFSGESLESIKAQADDIRKNKLISDPFYKNLIPGSETQAGGAGRRIIGITYFKENTRLAIHVGQAGGHYDGSQGGGGGCS